jgi:hypothetical protein
MTRFVYLTDTHIGAANAAEDGAIEAAEDGAETEGYHQQPCYAEHLPGLLHRLDAWMQRNNVDFVLHGGDVVDQVSENSIKTARSWFDLSVPVYVCLGNHDMTDLHAKEIWLREASEFFPGGSLEFDITCANALIHVMPNHWNDTPYYWDWQALHPHFKQNQLNKWHEITSSATEELTIILCTHNEVAAVPVAQTGFTEPYHLPMPSFADNVKVLLQQTLTLRCILSGHNHINTCVSLNKTGVRAVTASSFSEAPFEFKIFDIKPGRMTMRTINLMSSCDFDAEYNYDKTFVQGRLKDRAFELIW